MFCFMQEKSMKITSLSYPNLFIRQSYAYPHDDGSFAYSSHSNSKEKISYIKIAFFF